MFPPASMRLFESLDAVIYLEPPRHIDVEVEANGVAGIGEWNRIGDAYRFYRLIGGASFRNETAAVT